LVSAGAAWVAVLFPPETICDDVKVTVGLVASITTPVKAADAADVPPLYVCVEVNEYVPSTKVENVQLPVVEVAVKVQVVAAPEAGVAVRVTNAPLTNEPIFIVGVLSEVILSIEDVPRSEATSNVGVPDKTVHCAYKVTDPVET
jgi:hypothetical protein